MLRRVLDIDLFLDLAKHVSRDILGFVLCIQRKHPNLPFAGPCVIDDSDSAPLALSGFAISICWSFEYSSSERYSLTSLVNSFVSMKVNTPYYTSVTEYVNAVVSVPAQSAVCAVASRRGSSVGEDAPLDVTTFCNYNQFVRFDWDEAKRQNNLAKHGIDFADLEPLFDGETLTVLDDRFDYGERRFITLGVLNGVVLVVVHTETKTTLRIISARKATRNEENSYFKEIAN